MAKIRKATKAEIIDSQETSPRYERRLQQPSHDQTVQILFKVPESFKDEFTRYAFDRKMKYKDLLMAAFEYYRQHHRD